MPMSQPDKGDPDMKPAHILVVDDELDVKALFTMRFRKEIRDGALIFSFAENGIKALELIEAEPTFDLVLSDINMPEMDGLSLLNRIRTHYPLIQVVMVTAYGDLENIRAAMNAGSFDFLNKPFSMSDLRVTIGNALEHARNLRAFEHAKVEKAQAQEALIANLKRMDQLKDEFLANTTHELHTPLNGMIGLAEALIGGAAGPLNEKAVGDLKLMLKAGRRLHTLVDDILDFAKMRQEDVSLKLQSCDFKAIVDQVITLSEPLLHNKNVVLESVIPPALPPVLADENRLTQILHNLVENGVKFTEKGRVEIKATATEEALRVTISDTGCGIPEHKQSMIFNAFEQVDGSMTRANGGTGLGLAITKQLVTLHGGDITMVSEAGVGTSFTFTLPWRGPQSAPPKIAPAVSQPMPKREIEELVAEVPQTSPEAPAIVEFQVNPGQWTVLAVDDEPLNLQVLVNQLSLNGAQVDAVNSGMQALARLEERRYDLVILDVMMPGMSGFDVCREIRQRYSMSDLPVLMLTAKTRKEDLVEGMEAGANDYLTKPFESAELNARVKSLVTLRKAVHQSLDQARQLGDERKQREQLESLRNFNRDLSSTLELRQVLHRFLEHTNDCIPHELAFFCLDIQGDFQVVAERGVQAYEGAVKAFLHETCSQWSTLLKHKPEPIPMQWMGPDEALPETVADSLQGSWLGMPMMNRGKLVGTLFLLRRNAAKIPNQEIQLGYTFVGQACLAIENARLFEQVRHLAMTDALTGLYNRRFFFSEGQMAVDRARRFNNPLSLIMLDIDHFKKFNDEHSHAVGDQVLVLIAKTIKSQCRQADIAGRYGGEEIAILMPQTDAPAANEAAERLRLAIEKTELPMEGKPALKVTVSIGVTTFVETDTQLDDLLGRADDALYQAKDLGRNRVVSSSG